MHVLSSASGSAWSFGGSILTFLFPEILFVLVACALYVLYTKPEMVPGHWVRGAERSVSYTVTARLPEAPAAGRQAAVTAGGQAAAAGDGAAAVIAEGEAAGTAGGEAAGT
ncbi:MAG: hypothetical protein ACRDPY_05970, partial [Streptosporangiaceae bacterium]